MNARSPCRICLVALLSLVALMCTTVQAKDLEPRSYSNVPVGLNFLIAGYGYAEGKLAFDPSTPITNAKYRTGATVFALAHTMDVWGNSAKVDMVLPYSSFDGHALVGGQSREREVAGMNDPRFRFTMNFYGAPALSLKEYAGYQQDVIVGASLQVTAPLGQYDHSKLINIGNNRWAFKSELGVSKAWGRWTVEVAPSLTFYTDNTDFNQGRTLAQDPLYMLQTHVIYGFSSGIWLAFDGAWFTGERTTLEGVKGDNRQTNSRAGITIALPMDRHNSVKLFGSTGTSTRTGSDYDLVGIAWQYRWGGGF